MRLWSRMLSWWAALRRRPQIEGDMDAELRFHIDAYTDDLARGGVPSDEAMRRARAEFGALDRAKEECRDANGVNLVEGFIQDVRYGLRVLRKNPGFTAVSLVSLGLGIGANSTIFSIVDTQLLRPWPVKDPQRLVAIQTNWPKEPDFNTTSYPDYLDMGGDVPGFSGAVAYGNRGGFISHEGQGQLVSVEVVSPNYFTVLGVRAQRGRVFAGRPEETAAEGHSVVLSYNLWQEYFGGDPSLPGKTTLLDGKQFTIVGVAPRDFCGPRRGWSPDIWVTTGGWATMVPGEEESYIARDRRWFRVAGRLSPGASMAQARAELRTLGKRLALASPATNQGVEFAASPAGEAAKDDVQFGIYLVAMVGLVLLISCANVANLLLAQMEKRHREIAMRRALGAAQFRLVRQLFTEGLVLSLGGGLLGVLLARLLMKVLPTLAPDLAAAGPRLDLRVLLFTAAISLLMAVFFGQAPAFYAARRDLTGVLKGAEAQIRGSARRLPLRNLLVLGEVAISVVLLAGSVLLLRSLIYSQRINPGFDVKKNLLMMEVAPPELYGYTEAQAAAIYPALAERAAAVPGVVRVSYSRRPPLTADESGETRGVIIPGVEPPRGTDRFRIRFNTVGPGFFATLGAHMVGGREFNEFDLPSKPPVVIINEAMARRFWRDGDAVGRSMRMGQKEYQIVGVVETGKYVDLHEAPQPYLFLPFTQVFSFECRLLVETAGDPGDLAPSILRATTAVDRNLPIVGATTLRSHMRMVLSGERAMAWLLLSLSVLGISLAAAGLFSTVAYAVSRRTHEIGVRMALGARRNHVMWLVLLQGLGWSAGGALIGLAGAVAASHLISQFVYGITAHDPLSYTISVVVAIGVALLASYFPARRAMKVDPMVALRHE
ncbi:MAG TPA: ABC transporter permease [Bryobacteraceae bacterium]|nr:ABC transporter permease [Bryobacteraceae bacterium]